MLNSQSMPLLVIQRLLSPAQLKNTYPIQPQDEEQIAEHRLTIRRILKSEDPRLLVIVGPCSIHDFDSGIEYAKRLTELSKRVSSTLFPIMRVYFEKPRTSSGWKGLVIDPFLNGSANIAHGFEIARQFLQKVTELRLPIATEILDPLTPAYIGDCISWAAIGARTAESPTHRHLASGLPMPVGFKNTTSGSIKGAIFGIKTAQSPQNYLTIDESGQACAVSSSGNSDVHLVLRGGPLPNYEAASVLEAATLLKAHELSESLLIDCSHGNSDKNHANQPIVFRKVLEQILQNKPQSPIKGMMLESHINEGRQDLSDDPQKLQYGVSITDSCMSWETTERLLLEAHEALSA